MIGSFVMYLFHILILFPVLCNGFGLLGTRTILVNNKVQSLSSSRRYSSFQCPFIPSSDYAKVIDNPLLFPFNELTWKSN